MHLKEVIFRTQKYPTKEFYPFNLNIFQETKNVLFSSAVTFFVGENGTGKSTLLRAMCRKCGIHIWEGIKRKRFEFNCYEEDLYKAIDVKWIDGSVPGSFFAAEIFRNFTQALDEWAAATPQILEYFGGKSLITQSHGQSLISFFEARFQIKGIYFLDEPETALSPKNLLKLLKVLKGMSQTGQAQFLIATHSPILMACPGASIYSFDHIPVKQIDYEQTEHYRIYRDFMRSKNTYLDKL